MNERDLDRTRQSQNRGRGTDTGSTGTMTQGLHMPSVSTLPPPRKKLNYLSKINSLAVSSMATSYVRLARTKTT